MNRREPVFADAPADGWEAPRGLKGDALEFWDKHYPMLQKSGVLKETDLPAFEALCRAWGLYKQADREASKPNGLVQVTEGGYEAPSGWVILRGKFYAEFKAMATLFGLTPTDRTRVKSDPPPAKDPFAEFLGDPVAGRIGA